MHNVIPHSDGSDLRFVLTGTFHSLNRGDAATQLVALRQLRERWPAAQIAVHTPHADADRDLYGDEIVDCSRRRPRAAFRALRAAALWRAAGGRTGLSEELDSYRRASVVIDLSGDGFTDVFGLRLPLSHSVPLLLAATMGKPYVLMAQSIGPLRRLRPWVRWILRRAVFITARDAETLQHLRAWRLPCPTRLTADLSFLLEPASRVLAAGRIASLGPYDASRPLVGIAPSTPNEFRVLPELVHCKRFGPFDDALVAICKRLAAQINAQVLLVPFAFGPGPAYDDRHMVKHLAARLLGQGIEPLVLTEPLLPADLKAVIGCCDVFFGSRTRSIVAAVSQGIPTMALAYSPRVAGLMERLRLGFYTLHAGRENERALVELASRLWTQRQEVRNTLAQALETELLPAARHNFDLLSGLIQPQREEYVIEPEMFRRAA